MDQPVTILGAGIVGICTALSLADRGVAVRIIDRAEPGQATSFGNAGVISPWSFIPQASPGLWKKLPHLMFGPARPLSVNWRSWPGMVPWGIQFLRQCRPNRVRATADAMELLSGASVDLYRRHLRGTGYEGLVQDSIYVHAFRDGSRASLSSLDNVIRQEKGAPLELIGADELHRIEPALSSDFQAAILIKGQARALSPGRIGQVLIEKAQSMGVSFVRDEVRALERLQNGWRISCGQGTYAAEKIVLSMGAWSPHILKPLGLNLPLMTERGYHVEFADPGIEINNSVLDVDAKFVASAMEGGARFAGQAEFAPNDAPENPRKQALMTRLAQATFPGLNTAKPSFWMGRRPSFPDCLPVLGEREGGLFLNFGHSHYGLLMAPKSGEVTADLVTGARPNIALDAFDASRFL